MVGAENQLPQLSSDFHVHSTSIQPHTRQILINYLVFLEIESLAIL